MDAKMRKGLSIKDIKPSSQSNDFKAMALQMFMQLKRVPESFVSLINDEQVVQMAGISSRMDVQDGQIVYFEGDELNCNYLAFILIGGMDLILDGKKLLDLKAGDLFGEMELCKPDGDIPKRQHTVVANVNSVMACFTYDEFNTFFEGLGPRCAKRLSRLLAEYVLGKVVKQEEEFELQDRARLENVSKDRRMAMSAPCPGDLFWNRSGVERSVQEGEDGYVPFYFETKSQDAQAMKQAIDNTMKRIPMLACLDVELKKKMASKFQVACKRAGNHIVYKHAKLEYFFIILKGDCGRYNQVIREASNIGGRTGSAGRVDRLVSDGKDSQTGSQAGRLGIFRTPSRTASVQSVSESLASSQNNVEDHGSISSRQNHGGNPFPNSSRQNKSMGNIKTTPSIESDENSSRSYNPAEREYESTLDGTTFRNRADTQMSASRSNYTSQEQTYVATSRSGDTSVSQQPGTKGGLSPLGTNRIYRRGVTNIAGVARTAKVFARNLKGNVSKHKSYELIDYLDEGSWFGEMALILDSSSEIDIKAVSDMTLLMLPAKAFREMIQSYEKETQALRCQLVLTSPFGQFLNTEEACKISDALVAQSFRAGDNVINSNSTDFYILQRGVAIEMKKNILNPEASELERAASPPLTRQSGSKNLHEEQREHREGSCFCEWNLSTATDTWQLSHLPLNPLVTAATDCTFLVLDRKTFIELIGSYDALISGGADPSEGRKDKNADKKKHPSHTKRHTLRHENSSGCVERTGSFDRPGSFGNMGSPLPEDQKPALVQTHHLLSPAPTPTRRSVNEHESSNDSPRAFRPPRTTLTAELDMETKISCDLGAAVYEEYEAPRFLQDILPSASILSRMSSGGLPANEDDGMLHMIQEYNEDMTWTPLPFKSEVSGRLAGDKGGLSKEKIGVLSARSEFLDQVDEKFAVAQDEDTVCKIRSSVSSGNHEMLHDCFSVHERAVAESHDEDSLTLKLKSDLYSVIEEMVDSIIEKAGEAMQSLEDEEGSEELPIRMRDEVQKPSMTEVSLDLPAQLISRVSTDPQASDTMYDILEVQSDEDSDEQQDAAQLSPVLESPGLQYLRDGRARDARYSSKGRETLESASEKLDGTRTNADMRTFKEPFDSLRPTTGGDPPINRTRSRDGHVGLSRPTTGSESRHSGSMHASRPTTSGPLALSRPNTSGGFLTPVMAMLARSTEDNISVYPLHAASTPTSPYPLHPACGLAPLDIGRPTTVGSVPRTPGGNVMMNPQGFQSLPSFKSPSGTPSQSRAGSRQQSRLLSRSSSGRPLSTDHSSKPADRRSRASTGHLLLCEDDFMSSTHPSQDDPTLGDLYDSEDEDDAYRQSQDADIMVLDDFGNVSTQGRVLQGSTRKPTTPDPNALYSPTKPGRQPTTPDPNALYSPTCLKEQQQQQQTQKQKPVARLTLEETSDKKLSPALGGRGSWGKSAQHPFIDQLTRAPAEVPGPGHYKTPSTKNPRGRISDSRPMTMDDFKMRDAAVSPGPLEYAHVDVVLPQGGRFFSKAPLNSLGATGTSTGPGPGEYTIESALGTRPTTKMSKAAKISFFEEKSKRGPGALSPGPAGYQNIQDHHHRFVTKMRDETEEMLEAKRRLAAMKAIADTHRRRAAAASTQRVEKLSTAGTSEGHKRIKRPVSVGLVLDSFGGPCDARAELPDPEQLCTEVRTVLPTRRAYSELGIELV